MRWIALLVVLLGGCGGADVSGRWAATLGPVVGTLHLEHGRGALAVDGRDWPAEAQAEACQLLLTTPLGDLEVRGADCGGHEWTGTVVAGIGVGTRWSAVRE